MLAAGASAGSRELMGVDFEREDMAFDMKCICTPHNKAMSLLSWTNLTI